MEITGNEHPFGRSVGSRDGPNGRRLGAAQELYLVGHPASAMAQVVRTICRRAERAVVSLKVAMPDQATRLEPVVVTLNRLSDYFFVLAREILRSQGIEAHVWNPRAGQL